MVWRDTVAHTGAPYSVVKKYYDEVEEKVFGSPKYTEEQVYQKEFKYDADITNDYLDGVQDLLRDMAVGLEYKYNDGEALRSRHQTYDPKKHEATERVFHCQIMDLRVDYNYTDRKFVLYWIRFRPCAEGMGLYNVVLYWMVHLAAQKQDVGVQINDCLAVNKLIMRKKEWTETIQYDPRPGYQRNKHHFSVTHQECLERDSIDFWKIRDKIASVNGYQILLNASAFDTADKLNDYGHVERKFYGNTEAYNKHLQYLVDKEMRDVDKQNSVKASRSRGDVTAKSRRVIELSPEDRTNYMKNIEHGIQAKDWRKIIDNMKKYPHSSPITNQVDPSKTAKGKDYEMPRQAADDDAEDVSDGEQDIGKGKVDSVHAEQPHTNYWRYLLGMPWFFKAKH